MLLLRNGLAKPVLEARWAEARVISRDEALIVQQLACHLKQYLRARVIRI